MNKWPALIVDIGTHISNIERLHIGYEIDGDLALVFGGHRPGKIGFPDTGCKLRTGNDERGGALRRITKDVHRRQLVTFIVEHRDVAATFRVARREREFYGLPTRRNCEEMTL